MIEVIFGLAGKAAPDGRHDEKAELAFAAASIAIRGTPVNAAIIVRPCAGPAVRRPATIAPDGRMHQNRRIASTDFRGPMP